MSQIKNPEYSPRRVLRHYCVSRTLWTEKAFSNVGPIMRLIAMLVVPIVIS